MNIFQKLSRRIIKSSFELSIVVIEQFSKMEPYHKKVNELKEFSEGTLGKEIYNCLNRNDITLVPKYESHDLKHVFLDYEMTAEGEVRMQAFMLGNGNYTVPCFAILTFGVILLPEMLPIFYSDYKKGRNSVQISDWTIDKYATRNLNALRTQLLRPKFEKNTRFDMNRVTKFGALASIMAGAFGMLFCLPFLFSSNLADLVGAGFPFVGGAILTVGGLLTLSNLSRSNNGQQVIPTKMNYGINKTLKT